MDGRICMVDGRAVIDSLALLAALSVRSTGREFCRYHLSLLNPKLLTYYGIYLRDLPDLLGGNS